MRGISSYHYHRLSKGGKKDQQQRKRKKEGDIRKKREKTANKSLEDLNSFAEVEERLLKKKIRERGGEKGRGESEKNRKKINTPSPSSSNLKSWGKKGL